MLTIKTSEIWTSDPPELILKKVKWNTSLVKFGPLNFFKKKDHFEDWIGEVDEKRCVFKLFRVTSKDYTSDFSVNGSYEKRGENALVKIKHRVHVSSIFGLIGILVFVYSMWFLLGTKGLFTNELYLIAALVAVAITYSFLLIRDINKNDEAIRELIERTWFDQPEDDCM